MREKANKITLLRSVLTPTESGHARVPLGVPRLDACLGGGLKRGTLHEIFAPPSQEAAGTGFVTALAIRLGGPLLWIVQDYSALEHGGLCATGLSELGLNPTHIILLRVSDAAGALRAAADALSCAALSAVVIEMVGEPKLLDLVAYRRLLLGAGESGVTALLLRFSAEPNFGVAETRWRIAAADSNTDPGQDEHWGRPVFAVELQRNRHGPGGQWLLQWSCDDGLFRTADCGVVVSASADRSAQAALAQSSAA